MKRPALQVVRRAFMVRQAHHEGYSDAVPCFASASGVSRVIRYAIALPRRGNAYDDAYQRMQGKAQR